MIVYVLDRAVSFTEERRPVLSPHVKGHLSVLLALLLLLKGADWLLKTWELNFSTRGVVFGASYTDVHAELPVLRFLAIVSVVAAVILLVNIKYKGWRLPAISVGLMLLVWLGAGQIYPAIVQSYQVGPNEIQKESPYIADNIESTRWAFGLDTVTNIPFPASQQLVAADILAQLGHHRRTSGCGTPSRCWTPTHSCRRSGSTTASRTWTWTGTRSTATTVR